MSDKAFSSSRYLGLCGCVIEQEYYRTSFIPAMILLKSECIGGDPDFPVILHREDIIKKSGCFSCLADRDIREKFNRATKQFYAAQDYLVITVVIDKKSHKTGYSRPCHPYHFCMEALIERFSKFLVKKGAIGEIFFESRGGSEDAQLQKEWSRFRSAGTRYVKAEVFRSVLPSDQIEFRTKAQDIAGLQLADVLANPTTQDTLIENGVLASFRDKFSRHVCEAVKQKYDCSSSGTIAGWGRVLLKKRTAQKMKGSA